MLLVALTFVFAVVRVLMFVHGLFCFGVFDSPISMSIRSYLSVFNARGCWSPAAMSCAKAAVPHAATATESASVASFFVTFVPLSIRQVCACILIWRLRIPQSEIAINRKLRINLSRSSRECHELSAFHQAK